MLPATIEAPPPPPAAPPLAPLVRPAFDYSDLTAAMAAVDEAIRRTRSQLQGSRTIPAAAAPDAEQPAELLWPDPEEDDQDGDA